MYGYKHTYYWALNCEFKTEHHHRLITSDRTCVQMKIVGVSSVSSGHRGVIWVEWELALVVK